MINLKGILKAKLQKETKGGDTKKAPSPPKREPPKNQKICLYVPDDLIKHYQQSLFDRYAKLKLDVHIEKTSQAKVTSSKYQWVLELLVPPVSSETPAPTKKFRFPYRITGVVNLQQGKLPPHNDSKPLKMYVEHFFELLELVLKREQNPQFHKLITAEGNLNAKIQKVKELEKENKDLNSTFDQVEAAYYHAMSLLLSDAIDKIASVSSSLGDVMQGITKIMVIDDLGERTTKGLARLQYKEECVFSMSSREMKEKYEAFKEEKKNPALSIQNFFFASPDFEEIDVLFINFWDTNDESMPVMISTRKKTVLSKEEESRMNADSEELQKKIQVEEEARAALKEKMKTVLETLKKMEASTDISENKYQAEVKKRKRLIKDMKRRTLKLKELTRTVDQEDEQNFYKWDLFETFKDKQSLTDKLGDTVADWGLNDFWKKHVGGETTSFVGLRKLAQCAKKRITLEFEIYTTNQQINQLSEHIADFAQKNSMIPEAPEEEKPARRSKRMQEEVVPLTYKDFIENHIFDKMELAALSCGIVNCYKDIKDKLKQEADEKAMLEAERLRKEEKEKAKQEAREKKKAAEKAKEEKEKLDSLIDPTPS